MKKGMTLPEIMITVLIIGIISAVIIPMANNSKPNETKIAFLKNYDELTQAVHELASNSRVFPVCQQNGAGTATYCFEGFPFLNDQNIRNEDGSNRFMGGNGKLCRLLAFQYDVDESVRCNSTALPASGRVARDNNFNFKAKNGADYRIRTRRVLSNVNNATFISEVLIDVNGNRNGSDCIYDDNCQEPDTFRLWITGDGEIHVGDRAGEYYLNTRHNVKSKHLDIRNNAAINAPNGRINSTNIIQQ